MNIKLNAKPKVIKAKKDIVCYQPLKKVDKIEILFFKKYFEVPLGMIIDESLFLYNTDGDLVCCDTEDVEDVKIVLYFIFIY